MRNNNFSLESSKSWKIMKKGKLLNLLSFKWAVEKFGEFGELNYSLAQVSYFAKSWNLVACWFWFLYSLKESN